MYSGWERTVSVTIETSTATASALKKRALARFANQAMFAHFRVWLEVYPPRMLENKIAVTEGLSEGEIVATAGVHFLRDGQQVRVLEERRP